MTRVLLGGLSSSSIAKAVAAATQPLSFTQAEESYCHMETEGLLLTRSNCLFKNSTSSEVRGLTGSLWSKPQEAPPHPRPSASSRGRSCATGSEMEPPLVVGNFTRNIPSSSSSVTRPGDKGNRATQCC